jgi:predicted transposase/invertase (TIGR01784 family)
VFDATDILPEYFFISVPSFNDRLEKEIDDWLYVMKYDNIPEHFHSPYMKQVAEKLNILKMTEAERSNYTYYQKKLYNDRDELAAAIRKGLAEGEAKGKIEGETKKAIEIAKKMLARGKSIDEIAELTELAASEIELLKYL